MKALLSSAILAILTTAAVALTATICADSACTNCTNYLAEFTVNGNCYTKDDLSVTISCSGSNVTTFVYASSNCTGLAYIEKHDGKGGMYVR